MAIDFELVIGHIKGFSALALFLKHRSVGGLTFLAVLEELCPRPAQIVERFGMGSLWISASHGNSLYLTALNAFFREAALGLSPASNCWFHSAKAQFQVKRAVPQAMPK
jgi:hypothetical protein